MLFLNLFYFKGKYIMKRSFLPAVAALMIAAVFTACPGTRSGTEITLISNKIEIDAALKSFAAEYEKKTGVKVIIRSFGGETPYVPNITAIFNSGIEPEIFVIEGKAGYDDAKRSGRIVDLSGAPWVKDTDVAYIDPENGNVIGFPVAIEGWGLGYNTALLAKAGINPKTLTNANAIRTAFEKIDSMKSELGIDAVVSMAAGPGMTWVTGLHGVNAYLSLGLSPYSATYINMMLNRQVNNYRLTKFAEYYNMLFRYANRNTLLTGGYDQQLGDFAIGKTVFIHQGNWTDPTFQELGITFEMGYVPHAFLDEDTAGIFVGASSWYMINARSRHIEEAKKFLAAMASTPAGHDYMVNRAGMVPAFKSVTYRPAGQFSMAVQDWARAGKIYAWRQNEMPDGFGMNTLGPIFHQMASGHINVHEFVRLFTNAVANIR